MKSIIKLSLVFILALPAAGCVTTYVPVSWGFGERVKTLSHSDLTLVTLYDRYDPQRTTLRVGGDSFDEVMMPEEVKYHLGAYRSDSKLIYRNLYRDYDEYEMRDLLVHEFAHHLWFTAMSVKQREQWQDYLASNPTPLQKMVRAVYPRPGDWDTEDFAFTVEYARTADVDELVTLSLITPEERDRIVAALPGVRHAIAPPRGHFVAPANKGPAQAQAAVVPQK